MGQRTAQNAEVILRDLHVHKENLLGKDGDGFRIALKTFDALRPAYSGAVAVGVAIAAFEYALKYSKEREKFGGPIFNQQPLIIKHFVPLMT